MVLFHCLVVFVGDDKLVALVALVGDQKQITLRVGRTTDYGALHAFSALWANCVVHDIWFLRYKKTRLKSVRGSVFRCGTTRHRGGQVVRFVCYVA